MPNRALRRQLVSTPSGSVHVLVAEPEQDTRGTVIFFHQSPSSSRMWSSVLSLVAADGYMCIAPDMLDYGQSDRQSRQLTVHEHAGLLLEASSELSPGATVLVGHHTGAVFAAAAAVGALSATIRGVCVIGYPLYTTWREKLARLGARMSPDDFSESGAELLDLWAALNRSIETETAMEIRQGILIDRLAAGPIWYTAYAALMATDLRSTLVHVIEADLPLETVWARDDAITRLEPGVSALTGVAPTWIGGGPWVTYEHPDRVAGVVSNFVERVL